MPGAINSESVFVTGHNGMLGRALLRLLRERSYKEIITVPRSELNLVDQKGVTAFFEKYRPVNVIHLAAKVGGIQANMSNPAVFLYENLMIQANVIDAAYRTGVRRLINIGSSCIYPRAAPQPMKEEYVLTGTLEPTNEGYAIAKIAGLKLMETYHRQYGFSGKVLIPCNLYGPEDSFDLEHSHVLSALVRRFCEAVNNGTTELTLWGSGTARREFMHALDCAKGILHFFEEEPEYDVLNLGPGEDISIRELAEMIAEMTGYNGTILWDMSRPDGMPRKCMDVTKMKARGFHPSMSLGEGIKQVICAYKNQMK